MTPLISSGVHAVLAGAAIGAQFSPVPALSLAIQLINTLITSCERVGVNDQAIQSLRQQSENIKNIMAEVNKAKESESMKQSIQELMKLLNKTIAQTRNWENYGTIKSWFTQNQIAAETAQFTTQIDFTVRNLMLQLQIAIKTGVDNANDKLNALAQNQDDGFRNVLDDMKKMQEELGKLAVNSESHKLAAETLYNIQVKTKTLLPDFELKAGEVQRISKLPFGGTSEFDFYEGLYLAKEKCVLKSIRCANFDDKGKKRLAREAGIWRSIYEIDKGRYFVPFYGVCYFDDPYPCLVSPFYKNGDIQEYIRKNPSVDRMYIIRHIAEGLKLLHSQNPPIACGEIKASKILVNDDGVPLIADFNLSKIIDEASGAPFTRTNVSADQYRWFAPEVCSEDFVLMPASDVYSFAMVVLEIMTGTVPFSETKRATEIVPKVLRGDRPSKPLGDEAVRHGLTDKIWELLTRCWKVDPKERPTIEEVLEELS